MDDGLWKHDVVVKASAAIKPTLWFVGSTEREAAENITKEEVLKLEELTIETQELKKKSWRIDNQIADILTKASERKRT